MKIALYIEDGLDQIVLTPQTEAESHILARLSEGDRELSIRRGEFYANRAGWVRQRGPSALYASSTGGDESTIIVLRVKPAVPGHPEGNSDFSPFVWPPVSQGAPA